MPVSLKSVLGRLSVIIYTLIVISLDGALVVYESFVFDHGFVIYNVVLCLLSSFAIVLLTIREVIA